MELENKIRRAVKDIKQGKVVAIATETVYGLAADIFNQSAILKIFDLKNRPADNPLIVHVGKIDDANKLAKNFTKSAQILANKFWPGPLTLILEKKAVVPNYVTANSNKVAIRMPNKKGFLEVLKQSNKYLAAPSANISGKPSPTKAEHVKEDFSDQVFILDEGDSELGLESTVIDMTQNPPVIARPGMITKEMIENEIGPVKYMDKKHSLISPGIKYKHYQPQGKLILKDSIEEAEEYVQQNANSKLISIKNKDNSPAIIARSLYDILRNCKAEETLVMVKLPEVGISKAIMDRLKRAASS